jgi:hypothetical protein
MQSQSQAELDAKISEVYKHIQTERKILQGSQALLHATSNQDVLRRTEAKIRDTERSLSYFEDTLRELQARKMQVQGDADGGGGGPPGQGPGQGMGGYGALNSQVGYISNDSPG